MVIENIENIKSIENIDNIEIKNVKTCTAGISSLRKKNITLQQVLNFTAAERCIEGKCIVGYSCEKNRVVGVTVT